MAILKVKDLNDLGIFTLGQAYDAGYKSADTSWQRGYVSRKINDRDSKLLQGRFGVYALCSSYKSTQYCIRQYIRK